MPEIRNFHEALEKDLQRLTAEIKERQTALEAKEVSGEEVLKKSLEIFKEPALPVSAQPPTDEHLTESFLPAYLTGQNVDEKIKLEVERLVDMIFHQGIEKAVKESKKYPPFIEDAFHDALVDKLLPVLKERGIIK